MPCATVVDEPKLERMSRRTTPVCDRTSGPFEPSPGKGPAVSSGMTSQVASALAAAVSNAAAPGVPVAVAEPGVADDPDGLQPTIVNRPAPIPPRPSSFSIRRRSSVARSKTRPRSWSSRSW
jgi:hypothetical protein